MLGACKGGAGVIAGIQGYGILEVPKQGKVRRGAGVAAADLGEEPRLEGARGHVVLLSVFTGAMVIRIRVDQEEP